MIGCAMIHSNFQLPTPNSQLLYGSDRDGNWEIYSMDLVSGKEKRLTQSQGEDLWPVGSPDGHSIVFISSRDGNQELYVMDQDGSRQRRLTFTEGYEEDPVWSPIISGGPCAPPSADAPMPPDDSNMGPLRFADANPHMPHTRRGQAKPDPRPAQPLAKPEGCFGQQIVYVSSRDGNEEIYMINLQNLSEERLTHSPGMDAMPVWSPDGSQILFVSTRDGNPELYVLSSPASSIQHLVPIRLTYHPSSDGLDSHVWSPDGNHIAFVSERDANREIYLMNADGSELRNVTQNASVDDGPVWSPDGERLAFISNRSGHFDIYALSQLTIHNLQLTRLTDGPGNDWWPIWSPDGKQIAFISERDGNSEIYVMQNDGMRQRRLTHTDAEEKWVSWIPE